MDFLLIRPPPARALDQSWTSFPVIRNLGFFISQIKNCLLHKIEKRKHTSGINGAPTALEERISQHMSFNHACFLSRLNPPSPTPIRFVISRVNNARIKSTPSAETFGSLGKSILSFKMDFCNSSFVFALKGLY